MFGPYRSGGPSFPSLRASFPMSGLSAAASGHRSASFSRRLGSGLPLNQPLMSRTRANWKLIWTTLLPLIGTFAIGAWGWFAANYIGELLILFSRLRREVHETIFLTQNIFKG